MNLDRIQNYRTLIEEIEPSRKLLYSHPIYHSVDGMMSLQVFMESHGFAVWDFMSLLKTLQKQLTCVSTPWIPPRNAFAARMINEIVLEEETDQIAEGTYRGHFDLYVEAMGEVDANGRLLLEFVDFLREGESVEEALAKIPVPESTKTFVRSTMELCRGKPHEVAAAFLFGRENVIPQMFKRILDGVLRPEGYRFHCFELYLKRHMELDEEHHGPMGVRLLEDLCGRDEKKWQEAAEFAQRAIQARIEFWDGLIKEVVLEREDQAVAFA